LKSIVPLRKDKSVIDSGVLNTKLSIWTNPGSGSCTGVDKTPLVIIDAAGFVVAEILEDCGLSAEKYHNKASSKPGENLSILSNILAPDCEISQ